MLGKRLVSSRKRAGLTQGELADGMGGRYDRSMISHVESGRVNFLTDGLAKAALALNVSTDYLLGLSDDPTPAAQLSQMSQSPHVGQLLMVANDDPQDIVKVPKVAAVPGSGMKSYDNRVINLVPFRHDWLSDNGISPYHCSLVEIQGHAMDPPLEDGSTVLLDHHVEELLAWHIYVLETAEGLVVRWAYRHDVSDVWTFFDQRMFRGKTLTDGPEWYPLDLTDVIRIVGEVKWVSRLI